MIYAPKEDRVSLVGADHYDQGHEPHLLVQTESTDGCIREYVFDPSEPAALRRGLTVLLAEVMDPKSAYDRQIYNLLDAVIKEAEQMDPRNRIDILDDFVEAMVTTLRNFIRRKNPVTKH